MLHHADTSPCFGFKPIWVSKLFINLLWNNPSALWRRLYVFLRVCLFHCVQFNLRLLRLERCNTYVKCFCPSGSACLTCFYFGIRNFRLGTVAGHLLHIRDWVKYCAVRFPPSCTLSTRNSTASTKICYICPFLYNPETHRWRGFSVELLTRLKIPERGMDLLACLSLTRKLCTRIFRKWSSLKRTVGMFLYWYIASLRVYTLTVWCSKEEGLFFWWFMFCAV